MATPVGAIRGTLRGRVLALVAALIVALVAVAVSTLVVRLRVQAADDRVDQRLVPAQTAAAALTQAYIDMETGERGFALTGEPVFLQPYDQGRRAAPPAAAVIARSLRDDPAALRLLHDVTAAGDDWLRTSVAPEIAARQAGTAPTGRALVTAALQGKAHFDALRSRLTALAAHVNARVTAEVGRARSAQDLANGVALLAILVAAGVTVLTTVVLRRSLTRPLGRLVEQVETVASGTLDQRVEATGPVELAAVARSVDAMRVRILDDMAAAATAREEIAMYAEGDRIARDLHDVVIQRLFAAGMRLESAAARHPAIAEPVREIVDEIDRSIREIRTVIFGLTAHQVSGSVRERIITLVRESERSLGFTPAVHFAGPVDVFTDEHVVEQLVPALGEMLSNVARHARATSATVRLEADRDAVRVVVTDDGVGPSATAVTGGRGLANLRQRAESLGGSCVIGAGTGGGTVVEWVVPTGEAADVAAGV